MLAAAERRLATADRSSRIEWIHADILEWQGPDARYDRIVTHFFLDLFTPPRIQRIAEKILHLATEDPLWINSDFVSGNQCLGQKFIMWAQYRFFRIFAGIDASRLCDPLPCLRTAGWEILEKRSLESGWISAHLMSRGHKGVHRPRLP
jgi:hypothetical protein